MKDYRSYMDHVSVDQALHDKIMNRLTQRPPRRRIVLGRYAPICACAVLVFMSLWAFFYLFPSTPVDSPVTQPDDTTSTANAPSHGLEAARESARFSNQGEGSLEANGVADLGKKITPGFIPAKLTLSQAQGDPDFGAYVPQHMPGFNFESAWRIVNQQRDGLRLNYVKGMRYLTLTISRKTTDDEARIVDLSKPETYDLALYPIPRAESLPNELREIVNNPVFKAEDLSLKAVKTRAYTVNDAGDDNTGYRMNFSVLYGDVVVELNVKGGQPEDIFNILRAIPFR